MAKTKQAAPQHVRDYPSVIEAKRKLDHVKQQLQAVREKLKDIGDGSVEGDALVLLDSGEDVATAVLPSAEIEQLKRQQNTLTQLLSLAAKRVREAEDAARKEIHEEMDNDIAAASLHLAEALVALHDAQAGLSAVQRRASERGASLPPENVAPLLGDPHQMTLKLPHPSTARRDYRQRLHHIAKSIPQLRDEIGKLIERIQ